MPVLQRVALMILMLAALTVAWQGAQQLQHALAFAPGTMPWRPTLKLAGGLLVVAWGWQRLRRLGRERDAALKAHARKPGRRFQASSNPMLQAMVLVVMLGFSLLLLFEPDLDLRYQRAGGVLMLLLTIYCGWVVIGSEPDDTPMLGMDAGGLDHAWFGRVPWHEVHGIALLHEEVVIHRHTQRVPLMVLGVARPDRYVQRGSVAVRLAQEQPFATGAAFGELRIPLAPLDERPARVVRIASSLRQKVEPPVLPGWRAGMTEIEVRRLARASAAAGPP